MVMDTVSAAYRTKTDVFPLDAGTLKSLHNLIQIGLHQRLILCAVQSDRQENIRRTLLPVPQTLPRNAGQAWDQAYLLRVTGYLA